VVRYINVATIAMELTISLMSASLDVFMSSPLI
jgi:hypothetical protein